MLALVLCAPATGLARDLFESDDGEYRLELRSALKGTWLLSFPPDDPILFPDNPAGAGLFRLRFDVGATLSEYVTLGLAYEHRSRMSSSSSIGAGFLPSTAQAPFRLTQLDWLVVDEAPTYTHQHEFDRGFISIHLPEMDLTIGRQAIGLGRGMLFSAVDIFAPFTPTEVDREWRRGVDAVHASFRIPEVSELSGDVIAAFGNIQDDALQSWSLIGRVRANWEEVDLSFLFGRRDEDGMVATVFSAVVGDAEIHAEGALFATDGRGIDGAMAGQPTLVPKALVGGSYMFDVGRGLNLALEYHYSGFGVADIQSSTAILFDEAFQSRFLRGDSQILGRHALALTLAYDLFDDLSASLAYLQSPVDGSGLVSPSLLWNHSDNITLVFNAFVPWGDAPVSGMLRSEYGASPITMLVQARIYD